MTEVIERIISTTWDAESVTAYLLDFENAEEWDAGTVSCVRTGGDGGLGTRYRNVSKFLGRETSLDYEVESIDPDGGFVITGGNDTVTSKDIVTVRPQPGGGARVTYRAEMTFHGAARFTVPLLRPFLKKLGDDTASQLTQVLADKAAGTR